MFTYIKWYKEIQSLNQDESKEDGLLKSLCDKIINY